MRGVGWGRGGGLLLLLLPQELEDKQPHSFFLSHRKRKKKKKKLRFSLSLSSPPQSAPSLFFGEGSAALHALLSPLRQVRSEEQGFASERAKAASSC